MSDFLNSKRKAPILISGYVLNGYEIVSHLKCKIPNVYWYKEGFLKVVILVLEALYGVDKQYAQHPEAELTTDVTKTILEDLNNFHKRYSDVVQPKDIDADIEILVDSLITEASMFSEQLGFPPIGSRIVRVYLNNGSLCSDIEID